MAELKTKKNNANVFSFIKKVKPEEKSEDCIKLLAVFQKATGEKPKMWGSSIIGFGSYHYKSERSKQEGDWPLTAFSPRKDGITLYIMNGPDSYTKELKLLGKHATSKGSCLYIKRVSEINLKVLEKIVKDSVRIMRKRYEKKIQ